MRRALLLHARPFQKLPGCRKELYEKLDRPALRELPARRYELAVWQNAKVNIDYHVQVDWHLYSVPYRLVHQEVQVRLTDRKVEIFHKGQCGVATTDPAHRPKAHQRHTEWTPGRMIHWAQHDVGPLCGQAVERLLASKPHPEQGYRSCWNHAPGAVHFGCRILQAGPKGQLPPDGSHPLLLPLPTR